MPELPECARTAIILNKQLQGKHLLGWGADGKSRYGQITAIPGHGYLTKGAVIVGVTFRGKKVVLHLEGADKSIVYIVVFLGMSGRMQYTQGSHAGVWFEIGTIKHLKRHKLLLHEQTLYFHDQRHFGLIHIVKTEAEIKSVFKNIGPDFLNDTITLEDYKRKLTNKRIIHHTIVWFVMEQKYFAGVGNYLKAEILYRAAIAPHRKLSSLTDKEIELVWAWSHEMIRISLASNGLTISDFIDPEGNLGTYQPCVYEQPVDPYGNKVEQVVLDDDRTTHWVPAVQK